MASKRIIRKKIKFELSIPGILGIGVVCFCVFLWMFLLGIWAGQTILLSSGGDHGQVRPAGCESVAPGARVS